MRPRREVRTGPAPSTECRDAALLHAQLGQAQVLRPCSPCPYGLGIELATSGRGPSPGSWRQCGSQVDSCRPFPSSAGHLVTTGSRCPTTVAAWRKHRLLPASPPHRHAQGSCELCRGHLGQCWRGQTLDLLTPFPQSSPRSLSTHPAWLPLPRVSSSP